MFSDQPSLTNPALAPTYLPVVLRAMPKFEQVVLDKEGTQVRCSTKAAIHELKRAGVALTHVQVVDFTAPGNARSRQYQAIVDALFSARLPDPIMAAVKARGTGYA